MATKIPNTAQTHQRVEGLLFEARTAWGTVKALGIPFEHVDRLWAVHVAIGDQSLWPRWVVSDVETGTSVPGVAEASPELARSSAIAKLDALGPQKLKEAVKKFVAGGKSRPKQKSGRPRPAALAPALHQL
ncbi:hypothetical protein [Ralstonia sp. ASV6]|uniref:hypothetical protein n=1 Tax=Ralstonia sp. ASV6 TaxID=2795124 RepID=UPI0018EE0D8F|nr:hypothetical protein [Ralstonia sp. ASV6]